LFSLAAAEAAVNATQTAPVVAAALVDIRQVHHLQ
jgi:hypothetical protein